MNTTEFFLLIANAWIQYWQWIVSPIGIVTLIGWWYKMVLPWIWPVKIIAKSKVIAVYMPVMDYHNISWVKFGFHFQLYPRTNCLVNNCFLQMITRAKQKFIIYPPVVGCEKLCMGTALVKNQGIDVRYARFEIDQSILGVSGEDGARELLRGSQIKLVLKVRFRDKYPISKRLSFKNDSPD